MKSLYSLALILAGISCAQILPAQQLVYKPPVVMLDFGSSNSKGLTSAGSLRNYSQVNGYCPDDGYYSFQSRTSDCFNGNWITLDEDHTPGDAGGKMMIVNASEQPGTFFIYGISGLKPGAHYELGVWLVNICRRGVGCTPTPPNISIAIETNGTLLAKFSTGSITPTGAASWQRYFGQFTMPPGATRIDIRMSDDTHGGCGNDFAIDDLSIREFEVVKPPAPPPPAPATKPAPSTPVREPVKNTPVPVVTQQPAPKVLPKTNSIPEKEKITAVKKSPAIQPVINNPLPTPEVLLKRNNQLITSIRTEPAELLVQLYDNGEVDGDTVSIYHNNRLVVARAGISEKPVSFTIKVDKHTPHHELVMVAENLGSIPPNTSLMIVTAGEKRHEVFITSTKQTNARVVIDLQEE